MRDPLNKDWLKKLLRGEPHFVIGDDPSDPYLLRWYVIPRNKIFNIYFHKFMRSDDDRAHHDHPWYWASLVLWQGYWEHRGDRQYWRRPGSFVVRRPADLHRVELDSYVFGVPARLYEKPCYTLFFTGPKIRDWGFKCDDPVGWRHWEEFTAQLPDGTTRGCTQ